MIYVFIATVVIFILLGTIYNKKIEKNEIYDDELSVEVEKLEDNIEITKQILLMLENNHTKVEPNEDETAKISFYNHKKDIIVMKSGDKKDYSRIIHISHECVHTLQDKKYLIMNKVMSNFQILYFLFMIIYSFYNENKNILFALTGIQMIILTATFFVKAVIEGDASYRALEVAKGYLNEKIDKKKVEEFEFKAKKNLYNTIPAYFFALLMQGGIMLLIVEIIITFK